MTATRAPWVGQDVAEGRFRVLGLLGEGGMASVFRAVDRQSNTEVVLKVPKPALLADSEFNRRFAREIRTLVELKHPSVVAVLGFARHDGVPFAVLEHLSGGTLEDKGRPCKLTNLQSWLPDIAGALDHIHAAGYVHRDVKPANILFDAKGKARIADFGIVKAVDEKANRQTQALTESGVTVGTPEYMAPELAKGLTFDGRVDQYALAVTVYEMLAGRRPIEGGTGPVILVKQIREKPAPLDEVANVSPAVAAVVARGLAKDHARRFDSCKDFARAIRQAATGTPAPTRSISVAPTPVEPTKHSWVLPVVIGCALVLFLAVGAGVLFSLKNNSSGKNPPVAVKIKTPSHISTPSFRLALAGSAIVRAGKATTLNIAIERTGDWTGEVELQVVSNHAGVTANGVTVPSDATTAELMVQVARGVRAARLTITGIADGVTQVLNVPLEIKTGTYSIQPLEDVNLAAGASTTVSVFVNRDGWDSEIRLRFVLPGGIVAEPASLLLPSDANEVNFRLMASSTARSGTVRLVDANASSEKAHFRIHVGPANSPRPTPPPVIAAADPGKLLGRLTREEALLCFHPKEPTKLYAWSRSGQLGIWNVATPKRESVHALSGTPTAATVSPEGKKVITALGNKVVLANDAGNKLTHGDLRTPVFGIYYEGGVPFFVTRSGIVNDVGKVVRPESLPPAVTAVRYGTAGPRTSLRLEGVGVTWKSGDKVIHLVPPASVVEAGLSHDGRWVVIATPAAIVLHDMSAAEPETPIWTRDLAGATAVAVSPDGGSVAVALPREIRLFTISAKN